MSTKNLLAVASITLTATLCASSGCTDCCRFARAKPLSTPCDSDVTQEKALELANKALRDKGWDPENFDVVVEEERTEWAISFTQHPPRPPGSEITYFISKQSGSVRTMPGE